MVEYENYKRCTQIFDESFPSHWEIKPIYGIAHEKKISDCTDLKLLSVYLDLGVIPFSQKIEKRTNVTSLDLSKYQRVDPGDFVLNNQQAWRGSVGISRYTGIVSPAYIVLELDGSNNSDFMNYMLRSHTMVDQYVINSKSVGSIQRNIHWISIKRTYVLVPPRAEQDQIVRFLDWKVSEINKLIGIRKKEIQELEELRRLTIINSVSNNGEIESSDWKTAKVKRICRMQSGTNLVSQVIDNKGKYPVYGGNGLRGYYKEYTNNGLYVLIGRQGALAGNVHLVDGKFWATDHAVVVYCSDYLDYKYAYYMFTGMNLNQYAFDTAAQPGLSVTKVLNLKCSFPPIKKQFEIVRRLDELCLRYDNAIRIAKSKIQLLQELKSVIISDVVTGKIDVRNITIPEYEHVDDIYDDNNEGNKETDETETNGEEA